MSKNVTQNVCHRPFNPATKALQFRAWQIAQREGGNITRAEIAAELGVSSQRLANAIHGERWAASLRSGVMDRPKTNDGTGGYASCEEAAAMADLGLWTGLQAAE